MGVGVGVVQFQIHDQIQLLSIVWHQMVNNFLVRVK